jgi:hypothetical protein
LLPRSNPPYYDDVAHHGTIYDAVDALKKLPKGKLQSIRTFLLEDRMPIIDSRPNCLTLAEKLIEGKPFPEREMCAVFLAGEIKAIYKQHSLAAPPIIMGTVDEVENMSKNFPNIDRVLDYWSGQENRVSEISDMSNAIVAERQRAKS